MVDLRLEAMLAFLLQLERATDYDSFFSAVVHGMQALVPSDIGVGCFGAEDGHPRCLAFGPDDEIRTSFNAYYGDLMPFPSQRILAIPQTDFRDWEDTEFVSDFLRPRRIWRNAASPSLSCSIALFRSKSAGPFTDREIGVLQTVAPHVDALYANLTQFIDCRLSTIQPFEYETGRLTRREIEVLRLASNRLTNAEIGRRLGISVRTVEKHFTNMYDKTGTGDRWALLSLFVRSE